MLGGKGRGTGWGGGAGGSGLVHFYGEGEQLKRWNPRHRHGRGRDSIGAGDLRPGGSPSPRLRPLQVTSTSMTGFPDQEGPVLLPRGSAAVAAGWVQARKAGRGLVWAGAGLAEGAGRSEFCL